MMKHSNFEITEWASDILDASPFTLYDIVFEINTPIVDGFNKKISAFHPLAVCKVYKALDWTIDTIRRVHKDKEKHLKFIAWIGGNTEQDKHPHIHSILEMPYDDILSYEILIHRHFQKYIEKTLKQSVMTNVSIREIDNVKGYSFYCSRNEGEYSLKGDEKILIEKLSSIEI